MSDAKSPDPYSLTGSVSHLLRRVEQLAADRFAKLVGDALTLRQFTVLAAISTKPGLKQADLVRATGIDRSTLADLIARLEKRGWVDRTTSLLDARAQSVHLSEAGRAVLQSATQHARAADAAIVDALPRTKAKSLLSTLGKLAKAADEADAKNERAAKRLAKQEARRKERERAKDKKKRQAARRQRAKNA